MNLRKGFQNKYYKEMRAMTTRHLRAYAMYDMGLGFCRNEIAMRDHILNKSDGKYEVYAIRVDHIQEDSHRGELKIGLEKIVPGAKGHRPYQELTFFNADALGDFLNSAGVGNPEQLLSRRLVGLFSRNLRLKWLIPYPYSVTNDDVNSTKVDAGDTSYLQ